MNKVIYLEADTEITAVIDRIKSTETDGVVLALPRGSTLTQSIVNLKLLKRVADGLGKTIFLAIKDKVTTNLAKQVGIQVFDKASDAENAALEPIQKETEIEDEEDIDPAFKSSIRVKTYNRFGQEEDDSRPTDPKDNVFKYEDEDEGESEAEEEKSVRVETTSDDLDDYLQEDEEESEELSDAEGQNNEDDTDNGEEEVVKVTPKVDRVDDDHIEKIQKAELPKEIPLKMANRPLIKGEVIVPKFPIQNLKKTDPKASDHKAKKNPRFALILSGWLTLVILVFGILFYIFVPYTTASMLLKTEEYKKDFELMIDRNANTNAFAESVPGELIAVEKEQTKKYLTTGKKDIGEKARGTVTFSNSLSSDEQLIAAGSKITSSDGKVFLLQSAVKIPGATTSSCKIVDGIPKCETTPGTIDGIVIASNNGAEYNIAPAKFTVTGFSAKVSAENKVAFAGGISRQLQVVTESDLINAEKDLKKEIVDSLKADLGKSMDDKKYRYFEETISDEVVSIGTDKKAGDEAGEFEYKVKAKIFAIGFIENQAKDEAINIAENSLDEGKMLVNADQTQVDLALAEANNDDGTLKLKASFAGRSGEKIDQSSIRQKMKNKKQGDALDILKSLPGVDDANIKNWPSQLPFTAYLSSHIIIKYDYSVE